MIKKFASFVGLFLSAILLIVSIFIIFNVVKINIFYRRDEINILRLVGATDWYIKTPFLIEGLYPGFSGRVAGRRIAAGHHQGLPALRRIRFQYRQAADRFQAIAAENFLAAADHRHGHRPVLVFFVPEAFYEKHPG